jgi:hypothetical protein
MRVGRFLTGGVIVLALVGGCSDHAERQQSTSAPPAAPRQPSDDGLLSARELAAADSAARMYSDSVAHRLRSIRRLSGKEIRALQRDVNRKQIAKAKALGLKAGNFEQMASLAKSGRLVRMDDTTRYWVVDTLTQSAPFLTPDAVAMLTEMGQRFQARLDSLGLPRFRMEVTSVMRTADDQADLRRINANASKIVSAHQFGTTLDVSHLRFAAPANPLPDSGVAAASDPRVAQLYALALDTVAVHNASALSAILGRVIQEMKSEGKLLVMMERQQAVYHMTVARRFPDANATRELPPDSLALNGGRDSKLELVADGRGPPTG